MRQAEEKRCAVYTRKSTDERLDAEFNSLDAQYDACASYVKSQVGMGWRLIDRKYEDGGYSGGTMNRPALTEMLRDIEAIFYHIGECRAMTYASIMVLGLPWRWGRKILKCPLVAK